MVTKVDTRRVVLFPSVATSTPSIKSPSTGGASDGSQIKPALPKCQLLPVDSNYEMLDNGSLSVMTSSSHGPVVYMSHEYTRINDSLFICVVSPMSDDDDITSGSERLHRDGLRGSSALIAVYQLDRIQILASLVGVLVSLTALIAGLLVVLCLPQLRGNSHGSSLVCLIMCLIIGQSLYLFSTLHGYQDPSMASEKKSSMICYWVSVMTHYFLLATFFWLNVLAMDTTRKAFSARDFVADTQVVTLNLFTCISHCLSYSYIVTK